MAKKCAAAILLLSLAGSGVHASEDVPAVAEGRYHKRYYKKWCGPDAVFDCYENEDPSECPPRTKSQCEALCDNHDNCNFLFYGWNPFGDYFRCAGFETCDEGSLYDYVDTHPEESEDEEDPVSISVKPDGLFTKVTHDVWCGGPAPVMDCYDVVNEDSSGCAPFTSQKVCENLCSATPGCNFLLYGWNPFGEYWRCAGFSECSTHYDYWDGEMSILVPTQYIPVVHDKWCGGSAPVMDCFDDSEEEFADKIAGCEYFTSRELCEYWCQVTPGCNFLLFGWNPLGEYWRCAGFSECSTQYEYLDGDEVQISAPTTYRPVADEGEQWCGPEGYLFDCFDDEDCADFDTVESCEGECNDDPDCNYMVWGWSHSLEHFRCSGFTTCDVKANYWDGDTTILVKKDKFAVPGGDWYRNDAEEAVGDYGGECYCPGTGTTYWVGDELNSCGSLACENGVPLNCQKVAPAEYSAYVGWKVTCLP